MNIQGFSSHVSTVRPLGGQLDITLNGVSKPQNVANTNAVLAKSQVGTIAGVLSDEENLALASLFQSSGQSLYTIAGQTQTTRTMPGLHLDVQA